MVFLHFLLVLHGVLLVRCRNWWFSFFSLNIFELCLRAVLIASADKYSINALVLGCVYLLKNSVVVVQPPKGVTTDLVIKSSRDYKLCTVWRHETVVSGLQGVCEGFYSPLFFELPAW